MPDNQNFDPATEPPASVRYDYRPSNISDRGSIWFTAGILSVMLVFGALWFVGIVDPTPEGQRIAASSYQNDTPPIDRNTITASPTD